MFIIDAIAVCLKNRDNIDRKDCLLFHMLNQLMLYL